MSSARFNRYIGIDYSGAETPSSSLKGLRIYMATVDAEAQEVAPPPSPRRYWTRKEVAHWLLERLREPIPTVVGINHGFSFPIRYFEAHQIPPDWNVFLRDFQQHWPTDGPYVYVDFVLDGSVGNGAARFGKSKWRRETEVRSNGKSVFQFDGQGTVAKSTHAGVPWLLFLRETLRGLVHFWPFDGFSVPSGKSVIAEVSPALCKHEFPARAGMTGDQHDAYAIASWLRQADASGALHAALAPDLDPGTQLLARTEGWILGVA